MVFQISRILKLKVYSDFEIWWTRELLTSGHKEFTGIHLSKLFQVFIHQSNKSAATSQTEEIEWKLLSTSWNDNIVMTNSSASLTTLALQTLPAYLLSYQSPAQRSMHRIPGSLNGPNKAIAKHLEIFRSDTDTTLALHMAAFWTNDGMTHC